MMMMMMMMMMMTRLGMGWRITALASRAVSRWEAASG